jgi:uncharacterized membrane protein
MASIIDTLSHSDSWNNLRRRFGAGSTGVNVGGTERLLSAAAGAAILSLALRRRALRGLLMPLGGGLLARAVTGRCAVNSALGRNSARAGGRRSPVASVERGEGIKVERSIVVDRPAAELYGYWRDFENLPRFMEHLVSVRVDSPTRSHWQAKAPAGRTVEWDAEIVNEVPDEIIAWKSVGEPDVSNAGAVNFSDAPGGRGTVVRVTLDYEPPAGRVGAILSHFFSEEPDRQIREDLRKFKQLMETGEITTSARRVESSAYVGSTPQE